MRVTKETSNQNIIQELNMVVQDTCSDVFRFVKRPGKDFSRARKLPVEVLVKLLISMEGNSINAELFNAFPDKNARMTASALVQQREKLSPEFFIELFRRYNDSFSNPLTMNGYRLLAIDGSDFCTPTNTESQWYIGNDRIRKDGQNAKGTCLLHANLLYDLRNKQYMDCIISESERDTAIEIMYRADAVKPIIIMDRGYSGYNMIEHRNRYGGKYVIRFPLSNTIQEIVDLPDEEVDKEITVKVSTKSKQYCSRYGCKHIPTIKNKKSRDKYSENTRDRRWDFEDVCEIKFRVVKFQINEDGKNKWEVLVTNLNRFEFPLSEMKKLYHTRWGIETSFRELKYALGAINFHSKKDEFILFS